MCTDVWLPLFCFYDECIIYESFIINQSNSWRLVHITAICVHCGLTLETLMACVSVWQEFKGESIFVLYTTHTSAHVIVSVREQWEFNDHLTLYYCVFTGLCCQKVKRIAYGSQEVLEVYRGCPAAVMEQHCLAWGFRPGRTTLCVQLWQLSPRLQKWVLHLPLYSFTSLSAAREIVNSLARYSLSCYEIVHIVICSLFCLQLQSCCSAGSVQGHQAQMWVMTSWRSSWLAGSQ